MYTTYIGKQFLKLYNQKKSANLSAKQFFNDIMFPLFFDSEKYFKWVVNSPLVQGINKEYWKLTKQERSDARKDKLKKLNEYIESGKIDSTFAIGFPAADLTQDTSGQVSSIKVKFDAEDIYCSWIGMGFGLEVAGKQVIFLKEPDILWRIFEGWEIYRKIIDQAPNLKGNEIDSWNSQRLTSILLDESESRSFTPDFEEKSGESKLTVCSWVKLIFALAKQFPKQQITTVSSRYIYDKQKYVTLGFVFLNLPEVYNLAELRKIISGFPQLSDTAFARLYETSKDSFYKACQFGTIGLQALEPKELEIEKPANIKKLKSGDEKISQLYYNNLIWRVAMLNNQELLPLAEQAANALVSYVSTTTRGKGDKAQKVKELLSTTKRRFFVDELTNIVQSGGNEVEGIEIFDKVVRELHSLTQDQVPYFISLVKYKYYRSRS